MLELLRNQRKTIVFAPAYRLREAMNAENLRALIAVHLNVSPERVTREADLIGDLGADSLSLAELTGVLEERTGKRIPFADLQDIVTVGDLEDSLSEQRTKS